MTETPSTSQPPKAPPIAPSLWPPLIAAIVCTSLIAEAIKTALTGRANGDLMVLMCPLLGAIFLSIPATQAWIKAVGIFRKRLTDRRLK